MRRRSRRHRQQFQRSLDHLGLSVLRGHLDRKENKVKLVWWVVLGLLGWLAFLATLALLAWLVRPAPAARPVPAHRLDPEDRKAALERWAYLGPQGWTERPVQWASPDYEVNPDHPDQWVRSTRSSCVHLDSQGDLSC